MTWRPWLSRCVAIQRPRAGSSYCTISEAVANVHAPPAKIQRPILVDHAHVRQPRIASAICKQVQGCSSLHLGACNPFIQGQLADKLSRPFMDSWVWAASWIQPCPACNSSQSVCHTCAFNCAEDKVSLSTPRSETPVERACWTASHQQMPGLAASCPALSQLLKEIQVI